jgi:hypothetical protein
VVRLKLAITPAGRIGSITPDNQNTDYASCVAPVLGDARFLKTRAGATLTFSIGVP